MQYMYLWRVPTCCCCRRSISIQLDEGVASERLEAAGEAFAETLAAAARHRRTAFVMCLHPRQVLLACSFSTLLPLCVRHPAWTCSTSRHDQPYL